MPRFDQSFTGLCEQNLQDTLQLKQRYLDTKNKRTPKSKDKKQQDSAALQSSVHVQQKFLKRPSEDHDSGGPSDGFEPPVKLQCTAQHGAAHQPEGLTKFSVEIVQQLEFTTSAANSQPQQISTNVTVKALTNASVKSDVSSPKSSNPSTPASNLRPNSGVGNSVDIGTLVECVKQEPDNDFADLDQCAAALEKDAAVNGGTAFGGFPDLIGEDPDDEIITSDAFKDLISDISNYPEFMKDFDFDENKGDSTVLVNGLKVEDTKEITQNVLDNAKNSQNTHSPLLQGQNYSPPIFDGQGGISKNRMSYSNMEFGKTELSPAAQTLKQMAEQHQHKNQMGLSFNPNSRSSNPRSPYPDFQFQGDYGSPTSNPNFKNSPNFPQPDMIKQEMMYQSSDFDMKRKGASIYKQQYSPYGSPSASSHGSPGYLPRGSGGGGGTTPGGGAFGGGTPPRPSSGPGGNNSGTTLQINQAQQLHISQQGPGHAIQVSAGQHLQLSGDLKGNVSIAAQQGMYFNQSSTTNPNLGSNSQQNPSGQQQNLNATNQVPQQQNQQAGPGGLGSQTGQQGQNVQQPGSHLSSGQLSNAQNASQQHQQGPYSNLSDMHGGGLTGNGGSMSNAGVGMLGAGGLGGSGGIPVGSGHSVSMPGNQHQAAMGGDMYSLSQTQTINFTQQSLRQRVNGPTGMPTSMGPNGPMGPNVPMSSNMGMGPGGPMGSGAPVSNSMGPRHMAPQTLEQQKLLQQQQQMLRAQQALMQQHMVRPPPPEYKANPSMMQGMQPRYQAGPPSTRRMPQPMPPSGPMMRSHNMYVMQQQHMAARTMYPRQQSPMASPESIPQHGNAEWRHLIMTQQQNANFSSQMRPNFQHQGNGFGMNTGNMQMTGLQHQQMRTQQGMVTSGLAGQSINQGMGQTQGLSQSPMQMNNLNQQMISHMQQQQALLQQQNSNQLSMTNMSMQQSQSLSISNQALQQQQQQQLNSHQQQLMSSPSNNNQSNLLSFNPQAADFNLDFLENLPTADSSAFTEQELLNSFDNDPGFNLQDIL